MKTLLKIDSSLRTHDSFSRAMGECFTAEWRKQYPSGTIIHRDVAQTPVPHLSPQTLNGFYDSSRPSASVELSDKFIDEIYQCDAMLITAPMYNFGISSSLKAYFDLVVRTEKTVRYRDKPEGLLQSKKAYAITTMGAKKETEYSLVEWHLKHILNYIGIREVHFFTLDGTAHKNYVQEKLSSVKQLIIHTINK